MEKLKIECPSCLKNTKLEAESYFSTNVFYPPVFDENGNNTNPDRNMITTSFKCLECNSRFSIKGNNVDGFDYAAEKG